jgi:hypothetical protein
LNEVLKRLEALERENQALKEWKENTFKKAREIYQWPRAYSYKLWWGVPVLSYTSYKKDESKDWLYKNPQGQFVSNHYLELTLASGKTISVEVNEFNSAFTRSEKITPKTVLTDGVTPTWYVFLDETYGEFTVLPSMIN